MKSWCINFELWSNLGLHIIGVTACDFEFSFYFPFLSILVDIWLQIALFAIIIPYNKEFNEYHQFLFTV